MASKQQSKQSKSKLDRLQERSRLAEAGGGPDRIEKQHAAKKMTARERIEFLLDEDSFEDNLNPKKSLTRSRSNSKSKTPVLDSFSRDVTKLAEEDALDPIIGRDEEIERVSQILSRRKKNNPILIGEPGVGKTAIVEGLALRNFLLDDS